MNITIDFVAGFCFGFLIGAIIILVWSEKQLIKLYKKMEK
jgi:hypothetical protein